MANSSKVQEAIKKVIAEIEKMTPEEYLERVLCLNGSMTEDLFAKVIDEVLKKKVIDNEDLAYFSEQYSITITEYLDVFYYIQYSGITLHEVDNMFPTTEGYFKYKENCFEWSLMIGQGSACVIRVIDYNDNFEEIKIDSNIKFYKRLKNDNDKES